MITVHFTDADGATTSVTARTGQSLMLAALAANVDGIQADCGGLLTCATCHVMVSEVQAALLEPITPDEAAMLDATAVPRTSASRLSCQIVLTDAMDGLRVVLPSSQY